MKSDDLRTMLATYCTLSKDSAPTPEEMRQKSKEILIFGQQEHARGESTTKVVMVDA